MSSKLCRNYVSYWTPKKHKKKKTSTQRHNNLSLLKEFKRFFIGASCRLPLIVGHLDDLWFVTTQPWSTYSMVKNILSSGNLRINPK